ncbi:hypothetical protein QCD75_21695, partial [Arthrobacter sp. PsM3]|nr:hypothetical protein [Arthrobacter sp. PsM3]
MTMIVVCRPGGKGPAWRLRGNARARRKFPLRARAFPAASAAQTSSRRAMTHARRYSGVDSAFAGRG